MHAHINNNTSVVPFGIIECQTKLLCTCKKQGFDGRNDIILINLKFFCDVIDLCLQAGYAFRLSITLTLFVNLLTSNQDPHSLPTGMWMDDELMVINLIVTFIPIKKGSTIIFNLVMDMQKETKWLFFI